jgi:PadR family transcriptional regulator, regulatory protein PadR
MNIQFKKGVLEMCVLAILDQKDCYGYELVHEVSKAVTISEGTIYPLLSRLKKDGLVTTYLKESTEGPSRKYYQLTELGITNANTLKREWIEFSQAVNQLIIRSDHHE